MNQSGLIRSLKARIRELENEVEQLKARLAAYGRAGGGKGGKARAAKQTPEERSALARKAAEARWDKYRAEKYGPRPKSRKQPATTGSNAVDDKK